MADPGRTRGYGPAILLLAGGAFLARTLTLTDQSLWLDEVDAIGFASQDTVALLTMMISPAQNGGLFYLLLKGWLSLAGLSECTLRYASVLPSIATVPLMYALGRRLFSPEAGFWAALLAATSLYLFFYAQEGKMYALYAALVALGMYLFLDALEHGGRRRWLSYAATTAAGLYVHLFYVFLLLAQHGIALVLWRRHRANVRRWYLLQGCWPFPYSHWRCGRFLRRCWAMSPRSIPSRWERCCRCWPCASPSTQRSGRPPLSSCRLVWPSPPLCLSGSQKSPPAIQRH